ncbi:hypothetical protein ACFWFF_34110 [Streptomyces sp. NPDC060223]|uniref:hypothetical protein n=1 Tax=unclassified Streptomyces TaxID=2593676 RepID=UPI00363F54DF
MTPPETTPYDDDRRAYSRDALGRLALSRAAVTVADRAGGLVATRNDANSGPGGRVSQALELTELAEWTLALAVVYERERGSSWEDIARHLGVGVVQAQERFSPELARWEAAFDAPYRLDETGCRRVPQLPTAAYGPHHACSGLDLWAGLHLTSWTGTR